MPSRDDQHLANLFDLQRAQLRAIDAWHESRRLTEQAAEATATTRQMRLDASYRAEARRREHAALIAQAHQQLAATGGQLTSVRPVRLVIAHRNEWLRDKVTVRLREHGVQVAASLADGADAAGAIAAEQPDLVLVEDLLPTVPGQVLVRRMRSLSPNSVVAVQVVDSAGVEAVLNAGAHAVFTKKVPPAEVADGLLECLEGTCRVASALVRR